MTTLTGLPGDTRNTDLTLSALTGLLPEDARRSAAIEHWLEAISGLEDAGEAEAATRLTDELVRFVEPQHTTPDPGDHYAGMPS